MKTPPRFLSLLVMLAGCICPTLCPAAEPAAPPNRTPNIYEHSDSGLRLEIPQGWLVAKANGVLTSSNFLLLTINNKRSGFQVQTADLSMGTVRGPNRPPRLAPNQILVQLQPGEISLLLNNMENDVMMMPSEADTGLRQLLAANPIQATGNPDLSTLSFSFHQGGQIWRLQAFLRAPITAEERQSFISMLEGLKFSAAPVTNARQAERLAWQHLPESIRSIKDAPQPPPRGRGNSMASRVMSTEAASLGYRVTITLARVPADVSGFKPGDTWKFFVSVDGKVTSLSAPAGSVPASTPPVASPAAAKPGN